jgi:hypothetical protein
VLTHVFFSASAASFPTAGEKKHGAKRISSVLVLASCLFVRRDGARTLRHMNVVRVRVLVGDKEVRCITV